MQRSEIPFEEFLVPAVHVWANQGLLLAAGDFGKGDYNFMTVGWGSFGVMWGKPFAQIVVRPTRHTVRFTDAFESFTLCAFPEQYREALSWCGSHSGRDEDKVKGSGLTPTRSRLVASPCFEEAELVVECRKIYTDAVDPSRFADPAIDRNYPKKDYHHIYFGEIVALSGTPSWRRKE